METIIMGMTLFQVLYFLAFAAFGQLIAIVATMIEKRRKIIKRGGFSIVVWLNENGFQALLTILVMIAGILFTEQITKMVLGQPMVLNEWVAFLSGLATEKIIYALNNTRKRKGGAS